MHTWNLCGNETKNHAMHAFVGIKFKKLKDVQRDPTNETCAEMRRKKQPMPAFVGMKFKKLKDVQRDPTEISYLDAQVKSVWKWDAKSEKRKFEKRKETEPKSLTLLHT